MSLLEISHLTTKFETQQGTVSAVRDVSYHLEEGEVLGIVGESGSGKIVGMIFQDFSLVDMCTCLQNVLNGSLARIPLWRALSGCFPRAEKEKALAALKSVGLESYSQTPAHALSGGQKQRVAIARTLMQDATILLADEPVASLDPLTARQVLELMRRLQQKQGRTVVMNSHNAEQARTWSDRIIGLKDGRIFFDGPPVDWTDDRLRDLYGRTQS